jgi:hypothetical protein
MSEKGGGKYRPVEENIVPWRKILPDRWRKILPVEENIARSKVGGLKKSVCCKKE